MYRLPLWSATGVFVLAFVAFAAAPASAVTRAEEMAKYLSEAEAAKTKGDVVAAAQLLQSAIIASPADPEPYNRLAELYRGAGVTQLARKYFGIALNIDPTNATALKGIALLDLAAGDRAGAEAQRDLLVRSCGAACPETAQVQQALGSGGSTTR